MIKHFFKWMGIFIVVLIVLVYLMLYFFQDKLIFQTNSLDSDYKFVFDQPFEEHFIDVKNSASGKVEKVNALWFKPLGDSSKGLILYFHGNRGNLQRWGNYAVDFTIHGYDVLMIDYAGYGKSTGSPSEQELYADGIATYKWAMDKGEYDRLIIYGRSLGSAVASRLASKVQPDLLILETPFDELRGAPPEGLQPLTNLLPIRSVFDNKQHLRGVKSRKIIFHGTNDRVVPLSSALKLRSFLDSQNDFIIIPEGGHRNLRSFQLYKDKIKEILDSL